MQKQINQIADKELDLIIEEYKQNSETYRIYGELIIKELSRVQNIHALNFRIKDPEHLREKIIRKNKEGKIINFSNYKTKITDLIGIRVLHIFKDEWNNIDKHIREKYNPFETIAYIRKGDKKESTFVNANFNVEVHKYGYRSLHYTFKTKEFNLPMIGEIQVRTIFEEAWSEMDHRVRYPNHTDNKLIEDYSLALNSLSGLGDEMGMNLKNITADFEHRDKEIQNNNNEIHNYIDKLNLANKEKTELMTKIQNRDLVIGAGALFGLLSNTQSKK